MKILLSIMLLLSSFPSFGNKPEEFQVDPDMPQDTFSIQNETVVEPEEVLSFDYKEFEEETPQLYWGSSPNTILAIDSKESPKTVYLYESASTNSRVLTYISNKASYNADAAFLKKSGSFYKIRIAGVTGWVKHISGMKLYSGKTASSVSHYKVNNNGDLIHYLSLGVHTTAYTSVNNGPAPKELVKNRSYYSYDGHYFYTGLTKMQKDYINNTNKNAVNSKPFLIIFNIYRCDPNRN